MGNYHDEAKEKDIVRLREIQKELPDFLRGFFVGIAQTTSTKTRLGYAYDLRIFFRYLFEEHRVLGGVDKKDLTISSLESVESEDIDYFLEYLSYYIRPDYENPENGMERHNENKGKSRKLAAVRSMFNYFYKKKRLPANPAAIVDTPKKFDKKIVRLDVNEAADFLDAVELGDKLSKHAQAHHDRYKIRDLALTTLLLGTGIRVSECAGINISDIDFQNNGIRILRKGGDETMIYFGDEVEDALRAYLEQRLEIETKDKDETALFISSQGRRLQVRSIQLLVKKYSQGVTPKKISPHKLRSTYGSNLYHETGDIYLVADTLGHSDINTTKRHYAEIEDYQKRSAAKKIKLRKE